MIMLLFLDKWYFVNSAETGDAISINPLRIGGSYITLPTTPGLGLEIKEAALEHYSYRDFPQVKLGTYADERP